MFFHNFKYALKTTLKNKNTIFWTLIFPIALGTFMYMAFGNLFEDEMFESIPVSVVVESENKAFEETLKQLDAKGEDRIIVATYESREKAKESLENEEVEAIIYVADKPYLEVMKNSFEATVLKTVLEEYEKVNKVIGDIGERNPMDIEKAVETITAGVQQYSAKTTSEGNQDVYTSFFYAIFAMSCLFAALTASQKVHSIQANASALGMRRCLSPNSKMVTVVAEFLSLLLIQFVIELITLLYLTILGVDFGEHYFLITLVLFFGASIGISMGILIGALVKNEKKSEGICVATMLFLSVLADLMIGGIKYTIEQKAPILNRINPATLIADSFYALGVYDTYDRYIRNLATLGGMSVALIVISVLVLRRNKYASL